MDPIPGRWPHAYAPNTIAQLVAELAAHAALVVWTRGVEGVEARTTMHLDGDVTTTITPQCLSYPQRDELFRQHVEAMLKVGALLRTGAARATRVTALVAGIVAAVATATDIIAAHSWPHILVTFGGVACVGMLVTRLVRPLGVRFLIRSARAEIATTSLGRRTANMPSASNAVHLPTSSPP